MKTDDIGGPRMQNYLLNVSRRRQKIGHHLFFEILTHIQNGVHVYNNLVTFQRTSIDERRSIVNF